VTPGDVEEQVKKIGRSIAFFERRSAGSGPLAEIPRTFFEYQRISQEVGLERNTSWPQVASTSRF
jgi:hypothetical protein